MRAMKDSGIPWIGEIPKDWVVRKLRNVGRFSASGIDKKIVEGEPLVHIINYVDVYKNPNRELRAQEYMIVSAPIEKCSEHQVNVGDMIFTPSSETIEDIGVSAVIMDELPNTAFSYHVLRFQPNNVVDLKYRKYFTNNNYCLNYFSSCATGTIRKTISRDVFKECLVVLPPLAEQQRIAEFLDRKCAEVDEMIALQEQIIEELKAYKQSVITEAVTKGLNPDVPMKDSGIEWIGEIPEHWRIGKIKMIAKTNSGSTPKTISQTEESSIVWIRTTDINDNLVTDSSLHLTQEELNSASCPMLNKDVCVVAMYGGGGTIGKCGILGIEATINQALCSIEVKSFHLGAFMFWTLRATRYNWMKFAVGTRKDPNISQEIVRNYIVPIPPIEEQQKISDYLNTKCTEIDNLISIKQSKIDSLKEYKKSIIYEYVTGKREVNE